ncbi:hypothetical protein Cadr_000002076 [Camelus dromedarius]|uniref:Uncharacterized protein n=1 Tax=Camelus dromedarius TaxID=9838 RepID=A0A5N4EFJ2_CAMDR|nr:hypothetical protein Cadr_000002076 [Camelus dromedarius]
MTVEGDLCERDGAVGLNSSPSSTCLDLGEKMHCGTRLRGEVCSLTAGGLTDGDITKCAMHSHGVIETWQEADDVTTAQERMVKGVRQLLRQRSL